jgi:pimeloyl-ACP methyl ester carboxylesterase
LSSITFVLVHGAWHSSSCWSLVTPLLIAKGHTVFAPDLPGHGNNALPLNKVSLKTYVTDLHSLITSITGKVVLVGHSMSGVVISEVANLLPEKIAHLVYVCAYLPCHNESVFDLISIIRSHEPMTAIELAMHLSDDKRSCTINGADIIPLFYNLSPATQANLALADFGSQATLPLATKVSLNPEIFSTLKRTYICCSKDKVIPLHHQRRMVMRQSCDTLLQMEADHSPFYSNPAQLVALLDALSS